MADFEKEEFKFPHEAEETKGKPLEAKADDVEIIIDLTYDSNTISKFNNMSFLT